MRARASVIVTLLFFVACVGDNPDVSPSSSSSGAGGGGPSARSVQCNDKRCATGDVCCLTFGDGSIEKGECTPEAACSSAKALVCDDTSDCGAGEICCVKTGGHSVQYGPSYCATACEASNGDMQLCREGAECKVGSCTPPQAATTPTGLKECKP